MTSFCFITTSIVLLPCYSPWDERAQEYQVGLRLCRIERRISGLQEIVTLQLPRLHADIFSAISIQPSRCPDKMEKPFFPSSHSSLIRILWRTEGEASSSSSDDDSNGSGPIIRSFDIFMQSATLLHLARSQVEGGPPIPWHAWGPRNTRLQSNASNAHPPRQHRVFAGNRYVRMYRNIPSMISVLDFTPGRWTWGDELPSRPNSSSLMQGSQIIVGRNSPTVISCREIFEEDTVTTSLPFSQVHRDVGFPLRGDLEGLILCDDERIVLIEVRTHQFQWFFHSLECG